MAKINELKYDLLRHLFYSPELAVSDSRLFPRLKKFLAEKKSERKQLIEAAREYFPNLDKAVFSKKKKKVKRSKKRRTSRNRNNLRTTQAVFLLYLDHFSNDFHVFSTIEK